MAIETAEMNEYGGIATADVRIQKLFASEFYRRTNIAEWEPLDTVANLISGSTGQAILGSERAELCDYLRPLATMTDQEIHDVAKALDETLVQLKIDDLVIPWGADGCTEHGSDSSCGEFHIKNAVDALASDSVGLMRFVTVRREFCDRHGLQAVLPMEG